jgi:hypothetical protein
MKRLLLSAAMFLCCVATSFAQFSGSGSGTENDPYLILNPIQLNQLRNFLNQSGVYFKVMANIDLTEYLEDENPDQGWQPVGNSSSAAFRGVLDGNGKTIKGLWIKRASTSYVGFFGYTSGATIKNVFIEASTIEGNENVGGISGCSSASTISGCSFRGSIKGTSNVGGYIGFSYDNMELSDNIANVNITGTGNNIGGFIGFSNAQYNLTVTGCILNDGIINGTDCVGGFCGKNGGDNSSVNSISNTYIHANITGANYVGGLCGASENRIHIVNLNNCGFCGEIVGSSYVGGLAGKISKTSSGKTDVIQNNFAIGSIFATGDYVGGLIGADSGYSNGNAINLLNNYHSGPIAGTNYVGGLVGYKRYGLISKCYAIGSVAGVRYVGGLLGYQMPYTTLKCSVAINTRVTATTGDVNRVVGFNDGTIGAIGSTEENKSYNRTIVISQGVAQDITDNEMNGTGVSATTLKLKATYVAMGWDFTNTWEIQETECYPYMKSQTAPPVIQSAVVSGATTISGKCVDGGTVTLEIDGVKQQMISKNHEFSFTVSPLQAGHEVRVSAKADGKEQSYFTTAVVSFLGKGTEADPYQVYTAADLTQVYRKGYFKLMNDIDLTSYINQFSPTEGWVSIGRDGSETIHFDGNGHKITGLWCNSTRDNTGLFSCFANGEIKNLTVETAKNKQVKGGKNTGIIIGKMINGTIENCVVSGSVTDGTPVGGVVGLFDGGKISLCHANVNINTTGATSYVGGIVGEITSGEIDQCFTLGTLVTTGSESYAAGLVGKNSATVTNCYSNAIITSSYSAAGIVAYNYGVVDKCYATGNLFSSNYAAGIIGYNDGVNAVVKNCAAMNNKIDVTYESQQQQQGGGYGQRIIGGLKNSAPAPELNNYALKSMQVSVNNVAQKVYDDIMNGVGKNGSDLLKASTYQELGWNFTNTWSIKEDENYPSLKNNSGDVVKPGEDPNPDPDPEPTQTDDDRITVAEVGATKGQQAAFGIDLENKTTDLTAYQFDLTLPDGFSLSVNDKGKFLVTKTSRYEDDSQTLNISKLEGNTYRFVCFSMSNEIITGTSGAILNAALTIGESVNEGSYEATISNIVVTKTDGTQLKLSDAKFNIVLTNVIKGDANGDGEVNVSDIVEIVNYIMGRPSANFVQAAADVNGDGEINVTDIVKVVSIIMDTNSSNAPMRRSTMNSNLALSGKGQVKTALVQHAEQFTAAQFDIILADGQEIDDISLNSNSDHYLTWKMTKEGICRVVVYSLTNSAFNVKDNELMNISLKGTNSEVTVGNVILVAAYGNTTGIGKIITDKSVENWYTLDGRKLDSQPTKKGIYIKNGKKLVVR